MLARLGAGGRWCAFGHGLELHVAVLQLPLVVLLEQHGADQTDDGRVVGKDADHIRPSLELFVQPFDQIRKPA